MNVSPSNHFKYLVKQLPVKKDIRGNLTFVEQLNHIPFEIKRVFYIYDIPTGEGRGSHAHKKQHQFIICLSGSFDVLLDDGLHTDRIHLNRPWEGLHVPPLIWASEVNFDPGSVCLVLASDYYEEADYLRNYDDFLKHINNK